MTELKVGEFDKKVIKTLYAKGLIYLEVPISNTDYIAGRVDETQPQFLLWRIL